jgi:D-beta-D-heptose 7-phosphate kinase/D-beta-D-heptose 1-phosphate adenosyltransferase
LAELQDRFKEIIDSFPNKHVLVLGDVMLDHYIYSDARKLSREAPVIVADLQGEEFRPGGAANLATMIRRLGSKVFLASVVGKDLESEILLKALEKEGVNTSLILQSPDRTTCVKNRIYVNKRQYLRLDKENPKPLDPSIMENMLQKIKDYINEIDILILSDHDKGTLNGTLIAEVIKQSRESGKLVVGRPKLQHFLDFVSVNSLLSTLKEASEALGMSVLNDSSLRNLGFNMLSRFESDAIYLWNKETSYLFEKGMITYIQLLNFSLPLEKVGVRDLLAAVYSLSLAGSATNLEAALLASLSQVVISYNHNSMLSDILSHTNLRKAIEEKTENLVYNTIKVK